MFKVLDEAILANLNAKVCTNMPPMKPLTCISELASHFIINTKLLRLMGM